MTITIRFLFFGGQRWSRPVKERLCDFSCVKNDSFSFLCAEGSVTPSNIRNRSAYASGTSVHDIVSELGVLSIFETKKRYFDAGAP